MVDMGWMGGVVRQYVCSIRKCGSTYPSCLFPQHPDLLDHLLQICVAEVAGSLNVALVTKKARDFAGFDGSSY